MNTFAVRFWVGTTVLVAGLLGSILILIFGPQQGLFQATYPLHITFDEAPGVSEYTPVRRSGILIGRVAKVDLLPSGKVDVAVDIHERVQLPVNSRCEVRTSFLGDAEIDFFLPSGKTAEVRYLAAGDRIQGRRSTDAMAMVNNLDQKLSGAVDSVSVASEKLGDTLARINTMIDTNQTHVNSIMATTDTTLQHLQRTAQFTDSLLGDPEFQQKFKEEFIHLPETLRGARDSIAQLKTTMQNMDHTLGLVDTNLEHIKNFTEPLGENGRAIATNIDESVRRLNELMVEMETFGKSLNNPQSTIGRLTQDDEIYQSLTRTLRNVEEISYRLKPIVNDARIVSDRLARHPGSILRDAVRPGPGTKGLPPANWTPNAEFTQPSGWTQ